MTPDTLRKLMPDAGSRIDEWFPHLSAAMARFEINTPARQAAFLAQIAHESEGLTRLAENLNYSPAGLMATFNTTKITRFTNADAQRYGRTATHPANQRMIANLAYGGRMGNGPIESGDGWRYRGRGPGQLTGKANYARCGAAIGLDLLSYPELLEQPKAGALSFAWFWAIGNPLGINLNLLADRGDIAGISRAINGGSNGMAERLAMYETAMKVLA